MNPRPAKSGRPPTRPRLVSATTAKEARMSESSRRPAPAPGADPLTVYDKDTLEPTCGQ
jgi:hypothetical protein